MHNDLRAYWKRRVFFLRDFLKSKNIYLYAVELFGKGSPYEFDPFIQTETWWDCLFPEHGFADLAAAQIKKAVFKKLDEVNPDVIIAGSVVFSSGALGLRWAKLNKKKFIMFDDAKATDVKRNPLVQTVKNLIINQIDAFWLPSTNYTDEYAALYSKKSVHYFYGFNCIDNDFFKYHGERSFNYGKIISVCRLVPKKNMENLLKVWQFIEENNEYYKLIIIGDGPLLNDLKNLAKALKLCRVEFLGAVPNDQLPTYLHQADAFISTSLAESWGLMVNEAMAAGLPVLLSGKINAAATLLTEGVNGYEFDAGNLQEIQKKVMAFIDLSEQEKKGMSDNSLRIISTMDYENMGTHLVSMLKVLTSEPNKKISLLPFMLINLWSGRYNTSGWNNIKQ
ncbi:MAG: glycosyltransferase family 4 protein [Mucilaginibacter sp.]